jgi:hypothetical protein
MTAFRRLAEYFQRNGCIRRPNTDRLDEGATGYKKGWEVRIVLESPNELGEVRALLTAIGVTPARAYLKGARTVQPIYGRDAVELFTKGLKPARRKG